MKIVYHSYWGTYASYMMAALHAGIYSEKDMPQVAQIEKQYELCRRYETQYGNMIYMGLDDMCREIYCMGLKNHSAMILRAQQHMHSIFGLEEDVFYVDAKGTEGYIPAVISLYGKKLFKDEFMHSLFLYWFKRAYERSRRRVEEVKRRLEG